MKQACQLTKGEIDRLARLAVWGRRHLRDARKSRAPVIILTGTELFARFSLRDAWREVGGKHEAFVKPSFVQLDNLRVVADLTQQLYLGLPPYHVWLEDDYRNRAKRRTKSGELVGD